MVARKRTMASIVLRKMPMNFSLIYQFGGGSENISNLLPESQTLFCCPVRIEQLAESRHGISKC